MSPFLKWVIILGSIVFLICGIYVVVPAYPQPFFDFKLEHKNFTVYSDEKIPDDFIKIIDDVETRIKSLEIYDTAFQPRIFLCNNKQLYRFFAFWVRVNENSQGFNLSLLNNTFLHVSRINNLKYYHDRRLRYTHLKGNIAQVMAHELIHNLDAHKSGFWDYTKKPEWKKEGYCEYGSTISLARNDEKYDLLMRSSFLFEDNLFGAPKHSKDYYRAHLMVEYLFEKKDFTFKMLNDSSVTGKNVYRDLVSWYEGQK